MDQSDLPEQNGQSVKLGIYLFNELKKMTRGKIWECILYLMFDVCKQIINK